MIRYIITRIRKHMIAAQQLSDIHHAMRDCNKAMELEMHNKAQYEKECG